MRRHAAVLGFLSCFWFACTSLVDQDLSQVRCSEEGVVGPPACNEGQLCVEAECKACVDKEVCGDRVDNDCNGRADDGCTR